MNRQTKILIILFLIAFILRSVFLLSAPVKIWDETVYANMGYDLSNNPLDYSVANNGWSDFIPSGGDDFYAWPKMGFRAPLLPYSLSILYLFHLDFFVSFFMVFVGALSVCFVYLLGKRMFNSEIALYSAILFLFLPLHVTYSAKILTGVLFTFFVILTLYSFWRGYEEGNKFHKVLFGIFLALALLSRYTALWVMPVFLLYFLVRDRSLKFLKDKYLWYAIVSFFVVLVPWFIYGISEYNSPIGAFIHGAKASGYWGGFQSWHFFFDYWFQMFALTGLVFLIAIIYILYKKEFFKRGIYFTLIFFFFFLIMAIYMPHKEDRFILAITPAIAIISGYFLSKVKKYARLILVLAIIGSLILLSFQFTLTYKNSYTDKHKCFLEANEFLKNQENALVITDESPIVYYYTKQETRFYSYPVSYSSLKEMVETSYAGKNSFVFFTDYDMPLTEEKNVKIKEDLDKNMENVFECSKTEGYSAVYKF